MWPGKCPGSGKAVTPSATSATPSISSNSTARIVRSMCGRPLSRANAIPSRCVTYRAFGKTRRPSRSVFQPTWSTWRCVRKTTSTSSGATPAAASPGSSPSSSSGAPAPEAGRADAGVDEHRVAAGANEIGRARDSPARLREELRIELAVRRPVGRVGKELRQLPQLADRIDERDELDWRSRWADYHRTRSGGGSPCASCQPITGLRRTPIRSISASITSPGFR